MRTLTALLLVAALGGPACKTEQSRTPETAAPSSSPAASSGRSLATLDLCKLVPGDAVTTALGGKLAAPTNGASGEGGANCWYTIEPPGATGTVEAYIVYAFPPGYFEMMKGVQEGPVEAISGLGDDALLIPASSDPMHDLMVLKRGDLTLEIKGEDRQRLRKLAELVLSRL